MIPGFVFFLYLRSSENVHLWTHIQTNGIVLGFNSTNKSNGQFSIQQFHSRFQRLEVGSRLYFDELIDGQPLERLLFENRNLKDTCQPVQFAQSVEQAIFA